MKPPLCLRFHATQSQPCFPATSNALTFPVDNLISVATPTERITHYTLQAKSCAKGVPFGKPTWASYSIAHINRSILSLLHVPYSCLSQISLPPGALWHGFQLCNTQLPPPALQYNLSKENPPKTPFLQCMQGILTNIPSNFKLYSFILVQ